MAAKAGRGRGARGRGRGRAALSSNAPPLAPETPAAAEPPENEAAKRAEEAEKAKEEAEKALKMERLNQATKDLDAARVHQAAKEEGARAAALSSFANAVATWQRCFSREDQSQLAMPDILESDDTAAILRKTDEFNTQAASYQARLGVSHALTACPAPPLRTMSEPRHSPRADSQARGGGSQARKSSGAEDSCRRRSSGDGQEELRDAQFDGGATP